jgi:integrase
MKDRTRIGLADVRDMEPDSELWDSSVAGFGARRQRSAAVAYVLMYRTAEGRQRRFTIGRHGAPWNPDTARAEARRILGAVASGTDPAADKKARRKAMTVAELCDEYLADATAGRVLMRGGKPKKAATLISDKGRIDGHIRPLLGRLKVGAVTRADVEGFMHAVAAGATRKQKKTKLRGLSIIRGGRGVATRAVGLLGAIFAYAVERGMRQDNPAHKVRKYVENRRERRLSDTEYALLGTALRKAEAEKRPWPFAVAAARFLTLTGWRSGEALALRWTEVDLARRTARLGDTKTGASVRPLSNAACDLLRGLPRMGKGNLVFPATRGDGLMSGFGRFWDKIAAKGPLPTDISPHVLRHSFASLAGDLGYSEPTIATLIGHKGRSVTARYIHAADAVLLAAADAVANRTAELMGEARPDAKVVPLPSKVA